MSTPPVSIGLPVYNGARFLREALDSIFAQTYGDFDLVVSDNASTDETEEICRTYAAEDTRMRYVRLDRNHGAAYNYNAVFHQSAGPLFKWASHDDVLAPTYLERCVEHFAEYPQCSTVYPATRWLDEEGNVLGELERDLDLRQPTPAARLAAFARSFEYGNAAFGLMRRSDLDGTHLLQTFPSADFVMLAELALAGEIHRLPEYLFYRRDHPAMSRRANATPKEVAEWFVPGSGNGRIREYSTLCSQMLRAIGAAPISRPERAHCAVRFLAVWLPGNAVPLVREQLHRAA